MLALSQLRPTALEVMALKLKCGRTLSSISAMILRRSPSLMSFWMMPTTSIVTVLTSASGACGSWASALPEIAMAETAAAAASRRILPSMLAAVAADVAGMGLGRFLEQPDRGVERRVTRARRLGVLDKALTPLQVGLAF